MSAATTTEPAVTPIPLVTPAVISLPHPLKIAGFRMLWIGAFISLIGDQFYLVAMPWLVLQITNSGLALGVILMIAAGPRAVFMLMGGAVSDRFSSRWILMAASAGRMFLVAGVAALVYTRLVQLWQLYILAAAFGITDAFSIPAGQALIPSLVKEEQLPAANAVMAGTSQLSSVVGPAPAGIAVRHLGIAAAFLVDAVSFLFVMAALWRIRDGQPTRQPHQGSMWGQIVEGLKYVTGNPPMKALMLLVAVLNFGVLGPLVVGLATLAKQRFSSPAAYGTMLSSLAAGGLIGALLPMVLKNQRRRGLILLLVYAFVGSGMVAIGFANHLWLVTIILVGMGFGSGMATVHLQSWFQARVERRLIGRVMSVFMFAAVGLAPFSYALAGALVQFSLRGMFVVAGGVALAVTCFAATNHAVRSID